MGRCANLALDRGRLPRLLDGDWLGRAQLDFFGPDALARDPPRLADLVDADFAFAGAALAFGAADLPLGVEPTDRDAERSLFGDVEDFAFGDLALGRAPEPPDFDRLAESDAFTVWKALAPASVTASAPSATASPIERRTPPALRVTALPDRFTDFATPPAASVTGLVTRRSPLLRFLPWFMGTSGDWDSVPTALHFAIRLEPVDGYPPRRRFVPRFHYEYSQFSCRFISV
jgi:hypothetical protein